ncbi:MAG: hypothetical protein H8E73_09410 [Planctomycetes bacterium]|nr:hypothetical protein [Planctomycetota bacterium]MBL7189063.1 hypothetical protein [Phycisphaerae bacterium]
MNIHESLSSPGFMLGEQIARQVFEILPEGGPLVMIMDTEGNSWPSNSHDFAKLNISESFFKSICAKIDDGAEPVVAQTDDCSVVGAQLATDRSNCGYVIIALPQYTPESTLANIDLIEMLLNQLGLIAKLIEKNNLLYEVQMKHYHVGAQSEIASN